MKTPISLSLWLLASSGLTSSYEIPLPDQAFAPIPQTSKHRNKYEVVIGKDDLSKFPNITLDDGVYLPTLHNKDAGYISYKNIRYGQSPVGDLRFALPSPPEKIEDEGDNLPVFNGSDGHSCYQANPQWATDSVRKNNPNFNWEVFFQTGNDGDDCLFLDVTTPTKSKKDGPYPVLVWIYGGGYTYGAKDWAVYSPAGFYRRATEDNPLIFVAINYRMGAHGFLPGPKFIAEGGVSNIGLYDQKLALQWIQDNIEKFGGDPNQVTVMGESAGAGSIAHHLVWTKEEDEATPFQQAILQSPAWVPVPGGHAGNELQDSIYEKFLDILGAKDLADARTKSEKDIKAASRELVRIAPHGTFNAGPVVDGSAITAHPLTLMAEGKHDKNVKIFTGDVGGEGLPFVPLKTLARSLPELIGWRDWTNAELREYITNALPLISDAQAGEILSRYPFEDPSYWGRQFVGITVQTQRLADLAGEALVKCNARGISNAYGNDTYHYWFNRVDNTPPNNDLRLPVLHGGDVAYTFYDQPTQDPSFNTEIAENWQKYLVGFVLQSDPNLLSPLTEMPKYGNESKIIRFDFEGIATEGVDPYASERCDDFWPVVWQQYGQPVDQPPSREPLPPPRGPPAPPRRPLPPPRRPGKQPPVKRPGRPSKPPTRPPQPQPPHKGPERPPFTKPPGMPSHPPGGRPGAPRHGGPPSWAAQAKSKAKGVKQSILRFAQEELK